MAVYKLQWLVDNLMVRVPIIALK